MLCGKPASKIDQWIVPKGFMKNRTAAALQNSKQMCIGFRILDHVVQNAKANHEIEEVIRIGHRGGVHWCEFGGQPISLRRPIRGLDGGLRQVKSPDLRALLAQVNAEIAVTAAVVEHAQIAHISDCFNGIAPGVTPPTPSSIAESRDLALYEEIQEIV